jgi:ribosome-associated protein
LVATLTAISSWDKTLLVTRAALEKKAYDLVVMEVRDLTSIADYFVICSGRSDRQVQSIAQGIEEHLGHAAISPLSIEGASRGHWVLMDFSDVIVHIFYEPVRQFYDLDGLWGDAPRAELPEPYSSLVGQFQTADNRLS